MTRETAATGEDTGRSRTGRARRTRRTEPGRRDRLVDVALEIIARDGLVAMTCRSVAAAADVPLGSLTYHFAGVDALVEEAFSRYVRRCEIRFRQAMDHIRHTPEDLPRTLAAVVRAYATGADDTVLAYELYVGAIRNERLRGMMNRWMRHSRGLLERHMDPAKARVVDAMIEGFILHNHLEHEPMSAPDLEAAFAGILNQTKE